jgi:hypothetical protein
MGPVKFILAVTLVPISLSVRADEMTCPAWAK